MRRAVIMGASGMVGSHLLRLLLESPEVESVTALGRRALPQTHAKLRSATVDFADAAAMKAALEEARAEELFCCLGTTINKAGSQAAFRAVDFDAPLNFAKAGLAAGGQQYSICTAAGADPHSRIFYSRVKGELELALHGLAFPRGIKIARPSMLLGHREENRTAEKILMPVMKALAPICKGPLWKYRPIAAESVARAMLNAAFREPPGDRVYEGKPLFVLAGFP